MKELTEEVRIGIMVGEVIKANGHLTDEALQKVWDIANLATISKR